MSIRTFIQYFFFKKIHDYYRKVKHYRILLKLDFNLKKFKII